MATNLYIENEVVSVKNSRQIRSKYPLNLVGAGVNGNANIAGTLTVNGIVNTGANSGQLRNVVNLTATASVTQAQSGSLITLAPAAAMVVTLPATQVVGTAYDFVVVTSATGSNTLKIITGVGTALLQGAYVSGYATAGAVNVFESLVGTSNISVAMNGTTTGGLVGTQLTFTCLSATLWQVTGINFGSGTMVTAFATS